MSKKRTNIQAVKLAMINVVHRYNLKIPKPYSYVRTPEEIQVALNYICDNFSHVVPDLIDSNKYVYSYIKKPNHIFTMYHNLKWIL